MGSGVGARIGDIRTRPLSAVPQGVPSWWKPLAVSVAVLHAAAVLTIGQGPTDALIDVALLTSLGLAACTLLARLARRRQAHAPLVALHHLGVLLLVALLVGSVRPVGVLTMWAVTLTGAMTLLAIGRVGCHLGGCCHGLPVRRGVVYPSSVIPFGSAVYFGIPLAPVQLAEAVGCAALAVWSTAVLATPAHAALVVACGYPVLRVVAETWRGDPGRGGAARTNQTVTTCIAVSLTAIAAAVVTSAVSVPVALVAVASTTGAVGLHWFCRGPRLTGDDHLRAAQRALLRARGAAPLPTSSVAPLDQADRRRLARTADLVVAGRDDPMNLMRS